jgi:hypothetical protein
MTKTDTRARALIHDLLTKAEHTESLSRRNGWDTTTHSSVYPGRELVDHLLDIRLALTDSEDPQAGTVIDEALAEYGRRPGACTTTEVRELCDRIVAALVNEDAPS